jgi:GntR family transcriptional regulator/MocR family aminotransferase
MGKQPYAGVDLTLNFDRSASLPVHKQLARELRDAIITGRLAAGARLPSSRTLARELGVSRNTIQQVFDTLAAEGYLEPLVGAGSFVAQTLPEEAIMLQDVQRRDVQTPCVPAYPFRSLSRRGRRMVEEAVNLPAEFPDPFTPDIQDVRLFPMRTWQRLMVESSGRLQTHILANVTNEGYEPLRRAVAQHLRLARGLTCDWDQVIVTSGSQQSLDLVVRLLLDAGDLAWMAEPGYIGARNVLRSSGAMIGSVPCDSDGIDIARGVETLPTPKLIYLAPSSHYPLGISLSLERRHAVVDFAARNGCWILEDDYDSDFRYLDRPLPAVQSLDSSERVFYIGTFSKALLPSFRLGYLVVPKDFVTHFARARPIIDRHAPLMEQMALAEFLERGYFASHLRRMRETCLNKQRRMIDAFAGSTDGRVRIPPAASGTNLLVWLKKGIDDKEVAQRAAALGLSVRPVSMYARVPLARGGLVLGYAAFSDEEIDSGVRRLCSLHEYFEPEQADALR